MSDTTPTARDYVIAICLTFELPEEVLLHKTHRGNEAVFARQVMWKLMKEAGFSVAEVGRKSGRDRSTVLHGLRRLEASLKLPDVADTVEEARLLVPQIAHRRAQGEIFNLPAVSDDTTELKPVCEAPRAVSLKKAPKQIPVPCALDRPDDPLEVLRMRAHVRRADARFAEALMGEMA